MKNKYPAIPKSLNGAKLFCKRLCKKFNISQIEFDAKWHNFEGQYNQAASARDSIECSRYSPWNYDLLIFAVMHEIGHIENSKIRTEDRPTNYANKHIWTREFECWHFAINLWMKTFNQNISVKLARYAMMNLTSYIPDYNSCEYEMLDNIEEQATNFWCPITEKTLLK